MVDAPRTWNMFCIIGSGSPTLIEINKDFVASSVEDAKEKVFEALLKKVRRLKNRYERHIFVLVPPYIIKDCKQVQDGEKLIRLKRRFADCEKIMLANPQDVFVVGYGKNQSSELATG
jgi:hypothetical protein